ncbi:MAG TPA: hypothetical protein VG293_07595 [Solirubrobacteraceae bacterium]|nr:hypothetical protein [Solirubrobacteraceae bacterium]
MTEQKRHDPKSDPPGAVSDQNREEGQSGHRPDGMHPEPRTSGRKASEHDPPDPNTGASGEGSQSTGHRRNAG